MFKQVVVVAVIALFMTPGASPVIRAQAQQQQQQPSTDPAPTLKLTVVISRINGQKKVANLPFELMVVPNMNLNANPGQSTVIQTGAEVPIPTRSVADGKEVASYQYRSMGTNISANARNAGAGQFAITVTVNDSQLMSLVPEAGSSTLPRFQSFSSNNQLLLRDGQTVQYMAATDKLSGDTIRLEVTMNVVR